MIYDMTQLKRGVVFLESASDPEAKQFLDKMLKSFKDYNLTVCANINIIDLFHDEKLVNKVLTTIKNRKKFKNDKKKGNA